MSKLLNFLKFILLILACFGLSFVVVWPLWKFATSLPNVYTVTVLVLIALLFLYFVIRRIINHVKK